MGTPYTNDSTKKRIDISDFSDFFFYELDMRPVPIRTCIKC